MNRDVSHEIAQLMLSCIHAWEIDPSLDETCTKKLGMLKPVSPVSFGLLTRGKLSLMLPSWHFGGNEETLVPENDPPQPEVQ